MRKLLIASLLALAACSTPKLPDPKIQFPEPPAEIMKKPQSLETIGAVQSNLY